MSSFVRQLSRSRISSVLSRMLNQTHLNLSSAQSYNRRLALAAHSSTMPLKRKRSSGAAALSPNEAPVVPPRSSGRPSLSRQPSKRNKVDTNPDHNREIIDGKIALRASPDADEPTEALDVENFTGGPPATPLKANGYVKQEAVYEVSGSRTQTPIPAQGKKEKKSPTKSSIAAKKGSDEIKVFKAEQAAKRAATPKIKKEHEEDEWDNRVDPDGEDAGPMEDTEIVKLEARRPPPVNSDYLPLPWKGRLGYACLNTYLRMSDPPVFTSRTCRIASILEHRHPLKDPSQPEHATKNRPDKNQSASVERGQRYVEELCLANVRDISKILRWNDKYGIKFLRLSSEMFPFASHAEYGYKLAAFAGEALAEAGRTATELGHRLSTHPGQFTQLGSPRPEVIASAIRDLEYHNELLSLLKLPEQEDRDAVMILHMGGTFGDKAATLDRFRENYRDLSPAIKQRLVLENDDVSWSVHDLLPICEELNIPLCLDFHHHNIIFDSSQIREGTLDIMPLYPRIKATWDRKHIRQKMHYSEPCPEAITGRQRRKHNPRPITLPPCPNDMDLMIEAKDKEQACFELMRTFKLPGWDTFNNIVPYERDDDNRVAPRTVKKKKTKKQIAAEVEEFGKELSEEEKPTKDVIPDEEVGMGGKENRVYWPPGMEEWLRPKKRVVKSKNGEAVADEEEIFRNPTPANFAARKAITSRNKAPLSTDVKAKLQGADCLADLQSVLEEVKAAYNTREDKAQETPLKKAPAKAKGKGGSRKEVTREKKNAKTAPTPSISNLEEDEDEDLSMPDVSGEDDEGPTMKAAVKTEPARPSGRMRGARKSYAEADEDGADDE